MTAAVGDARRRGLPELEPLLRTLAEATRALRAASWTQRADQAPPALPGGPGPVEPLPRPAATPRTGPPDARPAPATHLESIAQLGGLLRNGDVTSRELTEACLTAIEAGNPRLNAFITVTAALARAQADRADRERAAGRVRGALHGIPISLKDLVDLEGVPTTAASRVRAGVVARRDAPVTERLKAAGAVIVGKCNLHEFAFGTTNEESAYGPARHPLDPTRSPGGSSGGSAAAVLAGMCAASIGTDTGGSIRIPAAACGLVGLKPTFGEVPCAGIVPLAATLDHVGPIARSVTDVQLLLAAMRGDPTDRGPAAPDDLRGLRLGLPRGYFFDRLDPGVRREVEAAIARLRDAGVTVQDVVVPHAALIVPVYLHTVFAEAAAYHAATLEARPGDYTPPVRLRLEAARHVLAEDYVRAQEGREVLRAGVDAALTGCHALVLPTLPITAPPLGASTVPVGERVEPVRAATLRLTQLFDLTGHPAITMPAGEGVGGLPVGLQLVGWRRRTDALLRVAAACEPAVRG